MTEEMVRIENVQIGDDQIEAIRDKNEGWVVVKRMCEALGVDANGQKQRLDNSSWATTCIIHAVGNDGKQREMFCLSVKSVPMWLATLQTSRLNKTIRPKIEQFQREAAEILFRWAEQRPPAKMPTHLEALEGWTAELRHSIALEEENKNLAVITQKQEEQLALEAPKVKNYEKFLSTDGDYSLQAAAEILKWGRQRMINTLLNKVWFRNPNGEIVPYQQYIDRDLFKVKSGTYFNEVTSKTNSYVKTVVTPKGLEFLSNHLETSEALN
jgi:phage antirepressor YoqD-like protein